MAGTKYRVLAVPIVLAQMFGRHTISQLFDVFCETD